MLKRVLIAGYALSLLLGWAVLTPTTAHAAGWISRTDSFAASWVKEIEQELYKQDYREMFLNDPRTPQASVLKLLNQAAMAYDEKNESLAQQFVREAINVLETGVAKNYYTQADVEPIIRYIKSHVPVKM
ncbi:hypothetical protein [Nitrospira sp. Kam-Ns4a]